MNRALFEEGLFYHFVIFSRNSSESLWNTGFPCNNLIYWATINFAGKPQLILVCWDFLDLLWFGCPMLVGSLRNLPERVAFCWTSRPYKMFKASLANPISRLSHGSRPISWICMQCHPKRQRRSWITSGSVTQTSEFAADPNHPTRSLPTYTQLN